MSPALFPMVLSGFPLRASLSLSISLGRCLWLPSLLSGFVISQGQTPFLPMTHASFLPMTHASCLQIRPTHALPTTLVNRLPVQFLYFIRSFKIGTPCHSKFIIHPFPFLLQSYHKIVRVFCLFFLTCFMFSLSLLSSLNSWLVNITPFNQFSQLTHTYLQLSDQTSVSLRCLPWFFLSRLCPLQLTICL